MARVRAPGTFISATDADLFVHALMSGSSWPLTRDRVRESQTRDCVPPKGSPRLSQPAKYARLAGRYVRRTNHRCTNARERPESLRACQGALERDLRIPALERE